MAVGTMNDEADSTKAPSRGKRGEGYSGDGESARGPREGRYSSAQGSDDRGRGGPMEVVVSHNIEKAMKILKRKLIKEGLFKELKSRRYYEKPSERRKRKEKESRKKARKEEARMRKGPGLI
jgi:small subunit ribosomal protein S21